MKRAALGIVAVAMLLAMPLASSSAFAAGKTARTTVTLTCDRATGSASATFQLYDGGIPYKDTCTDPNGVGSQLVVR